MGEDPQIPRHLEGTPEIPWHLEGTREMPWYLEDSSQVRGNYSWGMIYILHAARRESGQLATLLAASKPDPAFTFGHPLTPKLLARGILV